MAKRGKCEICGCTDARACMGGCAWVNKGHTLCSACEFFGDPVVLKDILKLVCKKATLAQIEAWTPLTRAKVLNWARAEHLKANDNVVRVPPMPAAARALKYL